MTDPSIVDVVRQRYAGVAQSSLSNEHAGVRSVAEAFGYTAEQLAELPAESNMGLSCGNPTATAHLRPGEVVVDLGSGGGIDVLLAARKVGPTGKAIGIDMTPEMIDRARAAAVKVGLTNAEFHLAQIDALPLPANSVDCLLSNCVINLAPDKPAVFREMFRVLRPGGRVAVSDIALKQPLPPEIGDDVLAYVGCIAGAVLVSQYESMLREAGFAAVQVVDTHKDLNAYAAASEPGCCDAVAAPSNPVANVAAQAAMHELPQIGMACCGTAEPLHDELARLLARYNINDYAASVQVYALKPS